MRDWIRHKTNTGTVVLIAYRGCVQFPLRDYLFVKCPLCVWASNAFVMHLSLLFCVRRRAAEVQAGPERCMDARQSLYGGAVLIVSYILQHVSVRRRAAEAQAEAERCAAARDRLLRPAPSEASDGSAPAAAAQPAAAALADPPDGEQPPAKALPGAAPSADASAPLSLQAEQEKFVGQGVLAGPGGTGSAASDAGQYVAAVLPVPGLGGEGGAAAGGEQAGSGVGSGERGGGAPDLALGWLADGGSDSGSDGEFEGPDEFEDVLVRSPCFLLLTRVKASTTLNVMSMVSTALWGSHGYFYAS